MVCDLAQFYNIHDFQAYPPEYVGTLVLGLPEDSRYKRALAGVKIGLTDTLLALIADGINLLVWQKTKDGSKGRNRPEALSTKLIYGIAAEKENREFKTVDTPEKFHEEFEKIQKGGK